MSVRSSEGYHAMKTNNMYSTPDQAVQSEPKWSWWTSGSFFRRTYVVQDILAEGDVEGVTLREGLGEGAVLYLQLRDRGALRVEVAAVAVHR